MINHTKESLEAFTLKVSDLFLSGKVRAPVHLCGGNEEQLLEVFKDVKPQDWVFSTWRSGYHALLKGMPEKEVLEAVLEGRSMYLCDQGYRIVSGSIVGGMLPIACGVAQAERWHAAKNPGLPEESKARVWVFVGDMAARGGLFTEFLSYCDGHELPVTAVVEDNGLSTDTRTEEAWGSTLGQRVGPDSKVKLMRYQYTRTWPHVGIGQHVQF